MARVVLDSKLVLDHLGHQTGAPQLGVVPQGLRAALENAFELLQILRIQQRFATCAASFLQCRSTRLGHCLRPPIYRLSVDTELPSDLGLAQASFQQTSCFEAPLLETIEITSYACWISHVPNANKEKSRCQLYYVTLNNCQEMYPTYFTGLRMSTRSIRSSSATDGFCQGDRGEMRSCRRPTRCSLGDSNRARFRERSRRRSALESIRSG